MSFSRGGLGEDGLGEDGLGEDGLSVGVDSPSEGMDTILTEGWIVLMREWTLFLVRVETFIF